MTPDSGAVPAVPAADRPLCIAIMAMGGQGGGVLSGWLVALAEREGWVAQATSVPGVAQRTGATVYYIEMMRPGADGRRPVLAQMPTPGDVDIVLAAEYMEAGRAILRGLVTPDRTLLIASNHRVFATAEKVAPGEGLADSGAVTGAVRVAARKAIVFDMHRLAVAHGSVISATLFGSLAASGGLPFDRAAFRRAIQVGGKGVAASLRAFDAACEQAGEQAAPGRGAAGGHDQPDRAGGRGREASGHDGPGPDGPGPDSVPASLPDRRADRLLQALRRELPPPAWPMAFAGLRKVVDFQDVALGTAYLDRLVALAALDDQAGGAQRDWRFTVQAAKYLANAMVYDDIIRVADLKTRSGRRARVARQAGPGEDRIFNTTEYLHPGMEEVVAILPAGLAGWLGRRRGLYAWLDRRVNRGRRLRGYGLWGFTLLYGLAGLRGMRRRSLRHRQETRHREAWLAAATGALPANYDLAVAILAYRRLIKGYADTLNRGRSKFDRVMALNGRLLDREDGAEWAQRLLAAAVRDASGAELDRTIGTIESFL